MSELTYSVPTVGEKETVAVPKVNTALTEIKTVVNGKIEAVNVKEESLTGKQLGSETIRMLASSKYSALTVRAEGEYEPSATRATQVILYIVHASATEPTITEIQVGGVLIGAYATEATPTQSGQTIVSFICPATVKWKWIKGGGGTPEVKSSYLTL